MKINSKRMKICFAVALVAVVLSGIAAETSGQVAATMDVFAFSGAGSFWSAAGNAFTMAAKIGLQTYNYYGATTWIGLSMTAAAAAALASQVVTTGLMVGSAAFVTYATIKGLEWVNGAVTVPDPNGSTTYALSPTGAAHGYGPGPTQYCSNHFLGILATRDAATAAIQAYVTAGTCTSGVSYVGRENGWTGVYCQAGGANGCTDASKDWGHSWEYVYPPTSHPEYITQGAASRIALTADELSSLIHGDLTGTDTASKAAAQSVVAAATGVIADPYNDWRRRFPAPPAAIPDVGSMPAPGTGVTAPAVTPGATTAGLNDLRTLLNTQVSPTDKALLESQDNSINQGKAAVEAATQSVTKDAVKQGIDEAAAGSPGDLTPPPAEANPDLPEKKSLTSVLDSFWSAIQNLPVVSMVSGLSLQASGGSPVVELSIPYIFKPGSTTIQMDFSNYGLMGVNYASILALVGNVFLAMCGIRWTLYLFRSAD